MKFIVNSMLGKLAKRLRMLGYDTLYDAKIDDHEILKLSKEQDRCIITRDTGLSKIRGAKVFLIGSTKLEEQIKELKKLATIKKSKKLLFSRCAECNSPLEEIEKDKIKELVPPFVYKTVNGFHHCPACKKIYWHGTHTDKLLKEFKNI